MTGAGGRWIVFVTVADRSGALTALSSVFSTRGVSFDSFDTLQVHGGEGSMAITFRGTTRLARVLTRTLERVAVVRAARLESAEDPAVRAVAVLDSPVSGLHPPEGVLAVAWGDGDAQGVGASSLLAGSLAEVEAALAHARAAGARPVSLTVLPPR